jgi:hypothetical protein
MLQPANSPQGIPTTAPHTLAELEIRRAPFQVVDFQFAHLRNDLQRAITARGGAVTSPEIEVARKVVMATLQGWSKLQQSGTSVPSEGVSEVVDLITRPGAVTSVLFDRKGEFAGYGLLLTEASYFPDLADIPPVLRAQEPLFRGIRLFIREEYRTTGFHQTAVDRIVKHHQAISAAGTLLTRVQVDPPELAYLWAERAFLRNGFERTAHHVQYNDRDRDGRAVVARGAWFVYPATGGVRSEPERHEVSRRARLAPAALLPTIHAVNAYHGREIEEDLFFLSGIHPRTAWVGVDELLKTTPPVRSPGGAVTISGQSRSEFFSRGMLHGVYLNGILSEVAERVAADPGGNSLGSELAGYADALSSGGRLIVRNPMRTHDHPVSLHVKNHAWFREFVGGASAGCFPNQPGDVRGPFQSDFGDDYQRFDVPHWIAAEFRLRLPYERDRARELTRRYAPYRAHEVESELKLLGFRLVTSQPETNRWINQLADRATVVTAPQNPARCADMPTNHVIIADKVGYGQGVEIVPVLSEPIAAPHYLVARHYQRLSPLPGVQCERLDLVERPTPSIDVLVWYRQGSDICLGLRDYPRPIVSVRTRHLDGSLVGAYLLEPLTAESRVGDEATPQELHVDALRVLRERALIGASQVTDTRVAAVSIPSPESVVEVVRSVFVEVSPDTPLGALPSGHSGVATPGTLRGIELGQLLHGCQLGEISDFRAERKAYELADMQRYPLPEWLGDKIELTIQPGPAEVHQVAHLIKNLPGHASFESAPAPASSFYKVWRGTFSERDSQGRSIAETTREYSAPSPERSFNSDLISVLPIAKVRSADGTEEVLVGLELRDLPAFERLESGSPWNYAAPVFRMSSEVKDLEAATASTIARFQKETGATLRTLSRFGGKGFTSAGTTPDVCYPMLGEVDLSGAQSANLRWVRLSDARAHVREFPNGHLQTLIYRAAHAFLA